MLLCKGVKLDFSPYGTNRDSGHLIKRKLKKMYGPISVKFSFLVN
jgi:hypothetical protein